MSISLDDNPSPTSALEFHLSFPFYLVSSFLYSAFTLLVIMLALVAVVLLIATACPLLSAFYVPGVTPKAYHANDRVPLLVNKIVSENTQLPFAYGDLPFVCTPKDGVKRTWLNLGEVLRGDRLMSSDYEVLYKKRRRRGSIALPHLSYSPPPRVQAYRGSQHTM